MPKGVLPSQLKESLARFGERYGPEERDNREIEMLATFSGREKTAQIRALIDGRAGLFRGAFDLCTALQLNRTYKSSWCATLLLLVGAGLFSPLTAHAQASGMLRGGGVALGYDLGPLGEFGPIIGALPGAPAMPPGAFTFRYMIADTFGVDVNFGFRYEQANQDVNGMGSVDLFTMTVGGGIVYAWQVHERASINFVARLNYLKLGSHAAHATMGNPMPQGGLTISAGLGPELFIFDRLSIEVLFGIAIGMSFTEIADNAGGMTTYRQASQLSMGNYGNVLSIVQGVNFRIYL